MGTSTGIRARMWSALAVAALVVSHLAVTSVPVAAAEDPMQARQWGLDQIRAEQAWSSTRGSGATIAIVDSGLDLDHPDLADRIVGGVTFFGCPDEPEGCGDGDWTSGEQEAQDADPHGTHVAGIAGATGGNGVGIAGVAPAASLLAVKSLGGTGPVGGSGTPAEVAAGIRWSVRKGADVVNLSLGQVPGVGQALSLSGSELRVAIREAVDAGAVVVAAAGNETAPLCDEPAFAPSVVCVLATARGELPASYSNRSAVGDRVLAAPGGEPLFCSELVLSTFPPEVGSICADPGYDGLSGTSMAAPHVAGVAALLLAQGLDADSAVQRMLDTARTPGFSQRGMFTATYGHGIVDAAVATDLGSSDSVVRRAAGQDRIETAVAASARTHDRAATVVLARADQYADALAGGPLAVSEGGPLLLTAQDRLSDATAGEIERLSAERAILLGGTSALGPGVEEDLRERGVSVERIAGANRFETAVRIASRLPAAGEVLIAEGDADDPNRGWPDALSASGLASTTGTPVLLVVRDALPPATVSRLSNDVDATIVGGTASVSEEVAAAIDERAGTVRRIAGDNRYATSAAVAREALNRGVSSSFIVAATGRNWPDGLAAGAVAGHEGGLLVLVDGQDLSGSPSSRDLIADRADTVDLLLIAGGTAAISQRTEQQLRDVVDR